MRRPAEIEQEVRFAVVMYGGVSLAIYINGVAQELFSLVQATAPVRDRPDVVFHADDELAGTSAAVYRELGRRLGVDGLADGLGEAVRTRFVVDVIAGTSAGGINGIVLAKAVARGAGMAASARLWLETADILALLRGRASWRGIQRAAREPESLLNGYRLYAQTRAALDAMAGPGEEQPAYADQVDLAVTATDLAGASAPVRLRRDHVISEPVHGRVLRFEYGTPATVGEAVDDFAPDHDGVLAFAARATSSFPFAFEPVALADVEPEAPAGTLAAWLPGYATPERVFFADGAYLDNKPFSSATAALRRRRADLPVLRRLVYVEPDPDRDDDVPAPAAEPPRPSLVRNVVDGMIGLPRLEPIRQDIATLSERNHAIARLREIERLAIAAALEDADPPTRPGGPAAAAYRALRERTVLDGLAALAIAVAGWDPDDDVAVGMRDALRVWSTGPAAAAGWVEACDARLQSRRLSYFQDRASELLRAGDGDPATLREFKAALNRAHAPLLAAERAPRARSLAATLDAEGGERYMALARAAVSGDTGAFVAAAEAFYAAPLAAARAGTDAALAAAGRDDLRALAAAFAAVDAVVLPLSEPGLGEANPVDIWRVSPRDARGIEGPALTRDPVGKLAGRRVGHFGGFLHPAWRANDLMWGRLDGAQTLLDAVLGDADRKARERLRVAAQAAIVRECLHGTPLGRSLRDLDSGRPLDDALGDALRAPASAAADAELLRVFGRAYAPPGPLGTRLAIELSCRGAGVAATVLAPALGPLGVALRAFGPVASGVGMLAGALGRVPALPVGRRGAVGRRA